MSIQLPETFDSLVTTNDKREAFAFRHNDITNQLLVCGMLVSMVCNQISI